MAREGASKPLVFDLIRDEIPHNSIDLSYEIRPGVGYVHFASFQETTGRELYDALESFGDSLKGWFSICAAIPAACCRRRSQSATSSWQRGQIIVSQRGRAFPSRSTARPTAIGAHEYPYCGAGQSRHRLGC